MKRAFGYSLLFGIFASFAATAAQYEPAVVFNATDVLGKQLTGSRYQVNAEVTNDGHFNHFVARLHGLDMRIISNDWMVEQLYEEDAIGVLRQIKQSDAYKRGLDAALEAPLALTRNTLDDPIATLESIPDGISNLLQDIGSAINNAGSSNSGDESAIVKDLIGFNAVKRRLASDLGIDVYSSNLLLQQEMDDVAWSMFAGGAVIDVALSAAPLVASLSVQIADQANTEHLNWKVPPATLQQAMARTVKHSGLNDGEIESLVFHKTCNLNHLSSIVTNMTALGAVKGVDMFYRQVNQLTSEQDCRTYQKTASLIYLYHVNKLPVQRIDVYPHYTRLIDVNKKQVMVVVADYLAYRPGSQLIFGSTKHANMLWLSGMISPTARKMLGKGIGIEESVSKQYQAPLDIVDVLLPERMEEPLAEGEDTNRTREVVDDMTSEVTNILGGVLGTLTSPLQGQSQQPEEVPAE